MIGWQTLAAAEAHAQSAAGGGGDLDGPARGGCHNAIIMVGEKLKVTEGAKNRSHSGQSLQQVERLNATAANIGLAVLAAVKMWSADD